MGAHHLTHDIAAADLVNALRPLPPDVLPKMVFAKTALDATSEGDRLVHIEQQPAGWFFVAQRPDGKKFCGIVQSY